MISVAICTYNRSSSLKRTLASLVEISEKIAQHQWELLIIDNNSTDDTKYITNDFLNQLPISYILEKNQGLSFARNCAIRNFKGDFLVFTDDDVTFSKCWLLAYKKEFDKYKNNPQIKRPFYFAGPITPRFENSKPNWIKFPPIDLISGLIVYYDYGNDKKTFTHGSPTPFGANMAFSRECVEKYGDFNIKLGPIGNDRGRGDDTSYLKMLQQNNELGWYLPSALNYHWISRERVAFKAIIKLGIAKGQAEIIGSGLKQKRSLKMRARYLFLSMELAIKMIVMYLKNKKMNAYQCLILSVMYFIMASK